jgi:2-keto-3-deoxy-L-rhamnonate aldolase RhmA
MNPCASDLADRLRKRVPAFGAWTSLGHPSITEIFTRIGVDFVGIDLEHSTISQEQAQRIIAASQAGGVACLPRVSSHNSEQIRRLLDSGADGVIVPNVRTVEEVRRIVAWCKYPPVGERGYGISRAQGYGFDFETYVAGWNQRSVLIIQIESQEGVETVGALLENPLVDGVIVGPYDISGSLGIPGQIDHPRVAAACARVVEACQRKKKACGTQMVDPSPEGVASALQAGYTFVVLSSDVFALWKWSGRMKNLVQHARNR